MAYRFLEHTADALVECRAEDFEKLLETAANALYAIAFETTQTRAEVEQVIQAEAEDDAALLVAWLQELIYLMEVKYFVASVFSFQEAAPTSVSATLLVVRFIVKGIYRLSYVFSI